MVVRTIPRPCSLQSMSLKQTVADTSLTFAWAAETPRYQGAQGTRE